MPIVGVVAAPLKNKISFKHRKYENKIICYRDRRPLIGFIQVDFFEGSQGYAKTRGQSAQRFCYARQQSVLRA
jgi:hypothetical protein